MINIKTLILSICVLIAIKANAQTSITGAYLLKEGNKNQLWLFADGYSSLTNYADDTYDYTTGGPFSFNNNILTVTTEYHDKDAKSIGKKKEYQIKTEGENLIDGQGRIWIKQTSKPQDLDGLWHITGRKQGDNIARIHQSGTRKTIKLLVDGYFQWMAIDPGAKTFSGTGGGHYTFKDGKYSEHILFFSRDNARVGANLEFDGKIESGEWHHSGLSSKGDPIYEIWSPL